MTGRGSRPAERIKKPGSLLMVSGFFLFHRSDQRPDLPHGEDPHIGDQVIGIDEVPKKVAFHDKLVEQMVDRYIHGNHGNHTA